MEAEAAKLIGAGIAVLPLLGVGLGIGNIFSSLINQSHATWHVAKYSASAFGLRIDRSDRAFRACCITSSLFVF